MPDFLTGVGRREQMFDKSRVADHAGRADRGRLSRHAMKLHEIDKPIAAAVATSLATSSNQVEQFGSSPRPGGRGGERPQRHVSSCPRRCAWLLKDKKWTSRRRSGRV